MVTARDRSLDRRCRITPSAKLRSSGRKRRSSTDCARPDPASGKCNAIGASGPPSAVQLVICPENTAARSGSEIAFTGLPGATTGTIASRARTRLRLRPVISPIPASRARVRSSGRISRRAITISASFARRSAKPSSVVLMRKLKRPTVLPLCASDKVNSTRASSTAPRVTRNPLRRANPSSRAGIMISPMVEEPEKSTSATKSIRLGHPGPSQVTPVPSTVNSP